VSAGEIEGEVAGKILRELGSLRTDLHEMRTQSDSRHRMNVNELAAQGAKIDRALEIANEAKRMADSSVFETRDVHKAVVEYTKGLGRRQDEQGTRIESLATDVHALAKETHAQTGSLATLVADAAERKERAALEAAARVALADADAKREAAADKRWRTVTRWWPIASVAGTALAAFAAFWFAHFRP
jgi:hypothetical protein